MNTQSTMKRRNVLKGLTAGMVAAGMAMGADVYVATDGTDLNPGTQRKPLATLQKAQEVVRVLATRGKEPVNVWLQPGTYYAGQPLVFGPEDSGATHATVTWQAVKEGTVTVSGGMRLDCAWKPYKDGIMVCDVPSAKEGKLKFSELYVNGKRQVRARFPNGDPRVPQPQGYVHTKGALPEWQNPPERPHTELYFDPATFTKKEWAHPEDAVVSCFQRICFDGTPFWNGQWRVRGMDRSRNAILLGEGGHQQLLWHYMKVYRPGIYPNMPFYVENVFEELDAPGEWYLDSREGKLYYKPEAGADLKKAVVEPALLQRVVQFLGTKDKPVRHLTLRGLWIAHAASTYFEPYTMAGMGDYSLQRGGAVYLEGAEDVTLDRCSLEGNNGNGFYVNGYARRVRLTNSRVADIGESGICFTGKDNYRTDKGYKCPGCGFDHWWGWDPISEDDMPVDCEATNNLIHDVGVYAKQCGGVFIANALRIRIADSHIYNCPRAGINVNNGVYGGHVFENNDLHDTVRETSDHGPFNSYGRDYFWCQHVNHGGFAPEGQKKHEAGNHGFGSFEEIRKSARETTIIRRNRFDGARLGKSIGPGLQHPIDLDDGSSNYEIYENLGIGMSIKTFCSSYCKFHDNVFVRSYELRLLQPFDGKLEIKDNRFINDLTPAEAADKFLPGVRFGLTDAFPAWLRDPDQVTISPAGGFVYQGRAVELKAVYDGAAPEIRYTLDGSAPTSSSPLYAKPFPLVAPVTLQAQTFRAGQPSGLSASATIERLLQMPDVFLDDLPLGRMKSGNEQPEKKTQVGKNCIGKPLRLGGATYERGIGDHAGNGFAAELVYALKPEYKRFVSLVGVDDQSGTKGSLVVEVLADGKTLLQTAVLRGGDAPALIDVKIPAGAKELKLVIGDAGDGYGYDDADFVNAGFVTDNPQTINYYNAPQDAVDAWRKLKFGMHMQWGPSVLRGGEISWSRKGAGAAAHQMAGADPEYDDYYKRFNPTNYNALALCQTLKDAGMRFATYCNKHHDSFCMWDTKLSDYRITNTPVRRDLFKEWAAACRETGLKLGIYPSQPDWLDPDYLRDAESHARYIKRLHGWVREMCANYGTIDLIEFDGLGGLASNWDSENMFKMIRELQPNVMANCRNGAYNVKDWPAHVFMPHSVEATRNLAFVRAFPGDFDTPESWHGNAEIQRMQTDRPWETCSPLQRGQWSYGSGAAIMSAKNVLQLLIGIVGMDGTLTLSVAIRPDGTFDERHVAVLKEVGQWLRKYGETIYETRGGPYYPTTHGVATYCGNKIFLHLTQWPGDTLVLPPIRRKLVGNSVLTGGTATVTQDEKGAISVTVSKEHRQEIDTIVTLTLDGPAKDARPGQLVLGSLAVGKTARASNVFSGQPCFAPENAVDDDTHTRWATDFATRQAWLEVDLGKEMEFNSVLIKEDLNFVRGFEVQVQKEGQWVAVLSGGKIGDVYRASFPPVKSRWVRLNILKAVCAPQFPARLYGLNSHMAAFPGPAIWEFQVLMDPSAPRDKTVVNSSDASGIQPVLDEDIAGMPGMKRRAVRMPDVFLDDLPLLGMKSGNSVPEKKTQMRKNCIGKPLLVGGKAYERGIGDHAGDGFAAELVYALKPEYKRFVSLVGVDDQTNGQGSIVVKVLVDGQVKAKTSQIRGSEGTAYLDVELPPGAKQLTLVIEDAGDGYSYDDADFVNAGFVTEGGLALLGSNGRAECKEHKR